MMMRVPLEEANVSLGLGAAASSASASAASNAPPLLSALHPSRQVLVLARGPVLSVLPVQNVDGTLPPGGGGSGSFLIDGGDAAGAARRLGARAGGISGGASGGSPVGSPSRSGRRGGGGLGDGIVGGGGGGGGAPPALFTLRGSSDVTALAWFVSLASARQLGAAALTVRPPSRLGELIDCECLLVGTRDGALQLHDAAGRLLFRQRLHALPVEHISVRPSGAGLRADDASEDVTVAFADSVARLSALELRTHLKLLRLARQSAAAAAGGGSSSSSVAPLSVQRFELPAGYGARTSAVCLGTRPRDLDALLAVGGGGGGSGGSSGGARGAGGGGGVGGGRLLVATGGSRPPLGGIEIDEHPQRSTLARLAGAATAVTAAAVGAASKAAALGPSLLGHGVRSLAGWVAAAPLGLGGSSSSSAAAAGGGAGAAAPSYADLQGAPKPEPSLAWRPLRDDARALGALVPAPAGALLAAPDALGRVLLVDGARMAALRMWKGYRGAQCGWALPPPGHAWARHGLLLAIYAPRRELVEVWAPRAGVRVAARRLDGGGGGSGSGGAVRLLPVARPCGGYGNELAARWAAASPASTLVLRLGGAGRERGAMWDVLDLAGSSGGGGGGGGSGSAGG